MAFYLKVALLLCISAQAKSESYTANQLIDLAIKNSYSLQAYELDIKSKEKISEQAGAWSNPVLEVGTNNKKENGGETKSTSYGLSQTIYMPGKFSNKQKIAKLDSEITKLDSESAALNFRAQILNLIYGYKASKEKLSHAKERLERFKTVEGFIKYRVFASPQKKAEASIVNGKLIVLQKELVHTQAQTLNLWNELNSYLKLFTEPEVQVSWLEKGPDISEKNLEDQFLTANLILKKQDAVVTQSKAETELAGMESWPGLTLAGSYSDGSGFNPERNYGLGISFPIPVFNANRSVHAASQLKSQAESERLSYLKEQSAKDLKIAFARLELAKKSVASLPVRKIEDLEKSIQETDRNFKRGQVDLLTYLEADSQHFESLSAILDSQLDLVKSVSDLQILTGNSQLSLGN